MTTVVVHERGNAEAIITAVRDLLPVLQARAPEIEASRRVPDDLLDDLVAAGALRVALPQELGGAGADLVSAMRLYELLARTDASVAWTVMIGSGIWRDLIALPRPTLEALYADGPDVRLTGVFNPTGVAVPVEGGYRVSGRWSFASGSVHASWLYGNCIEQVDGEHRIRAALFPAEDVHVEDTWDVLGMRGTASHHFSVDNVVVPTERTCTVFVDPPAFDSTMARIPAPPLFALAIASTALGAGRGALDEIEALATERTALFAPSPLAADQRFRHELATADTNLRAARALVFEAAAEAWATAEARREPTLEQRARFRAAAVLAVSHATAAVRMAFRAGGSSALYADSRLQRSLRDLETLAQHFLVREDAMTTAGAILAGQELDVPIF